MSIRRDYLERLIEQLAEAVARALGLARNGRTEAGVELLEQAIASGLGMPLPMLLKLTPETVASLFGPERARALVEALRAYSLLAAAEHATEGRQAAALAESLARRFGLT